MTNTKKRTYENRMCIFGLESESQHANNLRMLLRNSESIGNRLLAGEYAKSTIATNALILERLLEKESRPSLAERAMIDNVARETMMVAERYSKGEAPEFAKILIENAKEWTSDLIFSGKMEDIANALRKGLYPAEKYGESGDVRLFASMLVKTDEHIADEYFRNKNYCLELDFALKEMITVASKYNMTDSIKRANEMAPITTNPSDRLLRI